MIVNSPAQLHAIPSRIISLVPSLTELLFDLGLDGHVTGITKFCIHPPEWKHAKTIVGGTKNIDIEKIRSLQPQLVIAGKEENVKEQVEMITAGFDVYLTDICTCEDALTAIQDIGTITGTYNRANEMVMKIKEQLNTITPLDNIPAAYMIWRNPYMTVGRGTFIHDMLEKCGFKNIYGTHTRYPRLSVEELAQSGCRVLLLSSEPYPFTQKHIDELQQHLPQTKIMLADGEMFSWYGSRMLQAPHYFNQLIQSI